MPMSFCGNSKTMLTVRPLDEQPYHTARQYMTVNVDATAIENQTTTALRKSTLL